MDPTKVDATVFVEALKGEFDAYAGAVMAAVNEAPDGRWIAGSEELVRDLSAEFRRTVFQQAVQQRIDAAEAAFSPSEANGHRPADQTTDDETAEE